MLGWLTEPSLTRQEAVARCETACYRLVQAVVGDEERWQRVGASLARQPGVMVTE